MTDWTYWQDHLEITMDLVRGPVIGWLHCYPQGLVVGCADCPWETPAPGPEESIEALQAHRALEAANPGEGS